MKTLWYFYCFTVLCGFVVSEPLRVYIHHAKEFFSDVDIFTVKILRITGSGTCKTSLSETLNFSILNSTDHILPGKYGISEFAIQFNNQTLNSQVNKVSTNIFVDCIDDKNKEEVKYESSVTVLKKAVQQKLQFILYEYYESILPKGKPLFFNFILVQGRAVCELKITHPTNGVIQNQIINFGDKSNYDLAFSIVAETTKNITEDIKIRIEMECRDSFNDFYRKVINILVLDSDASDYVPPNMLMEIPFVTAGQKKYFVSFESASEVCEFSISGSAQANITGYEKYDFRIKEQTRRIYFHVFIDEFSTATSLSIQAKCTFDQSGKQRMYYAQILTTNQDTGVNGDPHFIQPVFDSNTFTLKSICYDFTGKSGNIVNIIQLRNEHINIYGELKDDYYMHKVFITFPHGNITADVHNIKLTDGNSLKWTNRHTKYLTKYLSFKMHGNILTISQRFLNSYGKYTDIIVKKSKSSITGQSLDVSIDRENYSYENIGGLLGRIGQNKYEFFDSVQKLQTNEDIVSSVRINGKLFLAKLENRGKSECWLLDINDLLLPKEILNFLK